VSRAVSRLQRFLAFLLCAALISAALDNVPDPPVIKPHRDKIASVYLMSPHLLADRGTQERAVTPPAAARRVELGSCLDNQRAVPVPPLLKQASDSSPPLAAS
jgi:hypothetical protein